MQGNLFSESWYRVCELRLCLLYSVEANRQVFRGAEWYILHDPFNNRFFRLTPQAWRFVARLKPSKTVAQVWEESLKIDPDDTPTQDETIRILSQLHHSNLLFFKNRPNTEHIFKRYEDRKRQELGQKLMSILFFRMPLWDPEKFLEFTKPLINLIFSRLGALIWMIICMISVVLVFRDLEGLVSQTAGILSPGNVIWLYLCLAFLKAFHELGHAAMTKRFGGEVHTIGIMLLVFTPLPYMDASSSWAFQNKWHRVLVGLAGMISEMFIAFLAAILWAYSGEGLLHNLAFNIMMIGSLSSFLFNGNPLAKLDAYYILSDWLEIPNLAIRSRDQWYYLFKKYIFTVKEPGVSPGNGRLESFWLLVYGASSSAYRVLISVGISLFVLDQWFELGVLITFLSLILWIFRPAYSLIHYLLDSPDLERVRRRSLLITSSVFLFLSGFLLLVPFPDAIYAPGVVHAVDANHLYAKVGGFLREIYVKEGQFIKKGETLAVFENEDLNIDIKILEAELSESKSLELKARKTEIADLSPIARRIEFLEEKISVLNEKKEKLIIRAEVDGIFVSPLFHTKKDTWFPIGMKIGSVIPGGELRFVGVVSQERARELFLQPLLIGEVKLHCKEEITLKIKDLQVIPYEKTTLPSAALGWAGGGPIAVSQKEPLQAKESFFEARGILSVPEGFLIFHDSTGILRIEKSKTSLLIQLWLSIRQILQKRYQI